MTTTFNPPIYDKYNTPGDVRRDDTISHAMKMSILETWAQDAEAEAEAAAEGMTGDDDTQDLHLQDIRAVLHELREEQGS